MEVGLKGMSKTSKVAGISLLAFFGLMVAVALLFPSKEVAAKRVAAQTAAAAPTELEAHVMCQEFVTARLKAPASAAFSRERQVNQPIPGSFNVASHVDSQNALGAKIRTNYRCKIRHEGGDRWKLEDLVLQP